MIMMKKLNVIIIILVLGLFLSACDGKKKDDLFKQEEEQTTLAGKQRNHSSEGQAENAITQEKQDTTTEENDKLSAKEISVIGDNRPEEYVNSENLTKDEKEVSNKETVKDLQGDSMETLGQTDLQLFYDAELTDEIKDRIKGKSYGKDCEVPYEELRYVKVLHWGFDGKTHTGELIVNQAIAEDIVEIFKKLYEADYPIDRIELIDEYEADDNASMTANNSSSFNFRVIDDGSKRLSLHSYGLAIDINPLYNPYVRVVDGETVVSPENGSKYKDRTLDCPYYIDTEDLCYKAFIEKGFTWGGDWINQKDYQHFQKKLP